MNTSARLNQPPAVQTPGRQSQSVQSVLQVSRKGLDNSAAQYAGMTVHPFLSEALMADYLEAHKIVAYAHDVNGIMLDINIRSNEGCHSQ